MVSKKEASLDICDTKQDYEAVQGMTNFFPVREGMTNNGVANNKGIKNEGGRDDFQL